MRTIEIRPSTKAIGSWEVCEGGGAQPAFDDQEGAIRYAKQRFYNGDAGEIHVFDLAAENIVQMISFDGSKRYGQ
jgi:hypothetical protein